MRRAVVQQVAVGGMALACLLGHASVASAKPTPQQKKAATEGFRQCREQEQFGDATTCWRVWLEKHRDAGSEAEVLVAEERVEQEEKATGKSKRSKRSKKKRAAETKAESDEEAESSEQEEEDLEEGEEDLDDAIEVTLTETPGGPPPPPPPPPANETLQLAPGSSHKYRISPGKAEGVTVGSSYVVSDASGNRAAYLKVMSTGPGGSAGASDATELSLRVGGAEEGARPEPRPMLGLSATLHGTAQAAVMNSDTTWYPRPVQDGGYLEYAIPKGFAGGGLTVGYELSSALGWYESHLRLRAEFLAGMFGGVGTKATAIPIELLFEKGFYLGKRLTLYGALGPNVTITAVEVLPPEEKILGYPRTTQHLQATRLGAAVAAGLEILISPSFGLRIEGNARINNKPDGYTTSDGGPIYWDFHKRSDSYSMVGGRLGAIAKF